MSEILHFLLKHDDLLKNPRTRTMKNEADLANEKSKLETNLFNCTCVEVLNCLSVSNFCSYHNFEFGAETIVSFLSLVGNIKKSCKVCVTVCYLGFIWIVRKYGLPSLEAPFNVSEVLKEPHITAIKCYEWESNPTFTTNSEHSFLGTDLTWIETIITFLIDNHSQFCKSINSLSLIPFVHRERDFKKQATEEILNLKSQLQIVDPIVSSNLFKNIKSVPFGCAEITFEEFRGAESMANRPGQNPSEFVFDGMISSAEFETLYISSKLSESPSRQDELLSRMRSCKSVNPFTERHRQNRHLSPAPFLFHGKEMRCEICEIPFTIYSENSRSIWFHLSSQTESINHFFHPVCLTLLVASQNKGIPITRQTSAQSNHDFQSVPFICLSSSCCDKNRIIRIKDLCSTNFSHLKKSNYFSESQSRPK